MALSTFTGNFVLNTDGMDKAITGVGFMPKLVIFWTASLQTAETVIASSLAGSRFSLGVSDGTNERCITINTGDGDINGVPAAFGRRRAAANALMSVLGGGSVGWRFSIGSMDADGFTITYPANLPGQFGDNKAENPEYIYFTALGGADLTEVGIGSFDSSATVGEQEVTGLGLTGKPDFLMLMGVGGDPGDDEADLAEDTTQNGQTSPEQDALIDAAMSVGMATVLNQVCVGVRMLSVTTVSETFDTIREEIFALHAPSSSSLLQAARLVTLEDDAFRLRWSVAAQKRVFFLALRGPKVKVGIAHTPDVPTKQSIPGVGLTPKTMFGLAASLAPSVPSSVAGAGFSWGGGDLTYQAVTSFHDATARFPQLARRFANTGVVRIHSTNGQIRALGQVFEFGNNDLTIDWVISDPPRLQFAYAALGDTDPAATSPQIDGNVAVLDQVGHELSTPLFVTGVMWSGATAQGHRLVLGESSTLGDATNEVLRMSVDNANQTVFAALNAQFLNGIEITQIDSGTVYVYLQTFSVTPVNVILTDAVDAQIIAAPGAGQSLYVTHAFASPIASGNNVIRLKEGLAGTVRWRSRMVETGQQIRFDPPWKLPENTALVGELTGASPDVGVTIQHFVAAS